MREPTERPVVGVSEEPDRSSRGWLIVPPIAAVIWCGVHLTIHLPRGWPALRDGEMAVLLPAVTLADGHPLGAVPGTLHGWELGSYLMAALVGLFVRAGLAPLVASKIVGMLLAAGMVGLGTWFAGRVTSGSRWVASAAAGVLLSTGWIHSHWNLAGPRGTTADSLLLHVAAIGLVVVSTSRPRMAAAAAGGLAGFALLFTPLALPTIAAVLLLVLIGHAGPRERLVLMGLTLAGIVAPGVLFTVLTPEGAVAGREFVATHIGLLGLPASGVGPSPGSAGLPLVQRLLTLLGAIGGSMEGEVQRGAFQLRELTSPALSWVIAGAPIVVIVRGVRGRRLDDEVKVAAAAVVAAAGVLAVPQGERWDFPSAYQYWSIGMVLGIVLVASALGSMWEGEGWRWARRIGVGLVLCVVLVPLVDAPRLITRPPPTAASELVNTGRNRLAPRPGYEEHKVFFELRSALSVRGRAALAQGYGAWLLDEDQVSPRAGPPALLKELEPVEVQSLFGGAGCRTAEVGRPLVPYAEPDFARGHDLCSHPGSPALGSPLPPRHSAAALYPFVSGTGSVWRRH